MFFRGDNVTWNDGPGKTMMKSGNGSRAVDVKMPGPAVIFILGPTSSGKTRVAASLAERLGGEVISCDSMQIYRGMDIVTQAPRPDITSRVKHHLIGEFAPEREFNAAMFADKAEIAIRDIFFSGKMPVFAGGSGLYVKALVDGLFSSPAKDPDLRARLEDLAREKGKEYLYSKLAVLDPETAGKLHINDTRRIIRAIEVYELTGTNISVKKSEANGISAKYNCLFFGLDLAREELYSRINDNVERMFSSGAVSEVEELLKRDLSLTARKALGIKEIGAFIGGGMTLEEAKEELKKNTRRYAKRQLTWFRADKRIVWINAAREISEIVDDIGKRIGQT